MIYNLSIIGAYVERNRKIFGAVQHSIIGTFYQPERAQRERLVLRLLYVFRVCLFVCLFVCLCVRTYLVRIYYVIRYYATAVYSSFWRFAGQAIANEGSFVLPALSLDRSRNTGIVSLALQL